MKPINQDEINNVAWRACDTFRGTIDPAQYKDYILVMLFLKYLSDVWKDKREEYEKEFKGDAERVNRRLARERFILPDGCDYYSLYARRNEANIGELINVALEKIEDENKAKLEGVFRNIDFNSEANLGQTKERNKRLKELLEDFAGEEMDLRPSRVGKEDIIGNTYQYLIGRFASDAGKKGGEFYTPGEVSELLAKLLAPKKGNRICDPTCGSGSLLIQVGDQVGDSDFSLYGQEMNGSTWALCRMNMLVHNKDAARIEWGDTIGNPKLIEKDSLMKFDVVVANPPFSLDKWGADDADADKYHRFHRGVPPRSKGDYAFISHMVETAVEVTGKVGVVVPHGVLFRGGAEGRIRQALIEANQLELVVGLPPGLFYGTGIPAVILIFNKGKKTKDVLIIDASREFMEGSNQNKLGAEHISKIVATYKAFKTVDKYAYRTTPEEIAENDFNLNIARYVDTFEPEKPVNLKAVQKEIDGLDKQLADVRKQMAGYLRELGYEATSFWLATSSAWRCLRNLLWGTPPRGNAAYFGSGVPWIKSGELNAVEIFETEESLTAEGLKNSAARIVKPGTNLIALYGATAGVVSRARISAAINQAVLAVVPNEKAISADYLNFILQRFGSNIGKLLQGAQPNLNSELVRGFIFDLPPSDEQSKIASVLQTSSDMTRVTEMVITANCARYDALARQLLTGKTRFKEFKNDRWRNVRVGDLLEPKNRYEQWADGRLYRLAGVRRNGNGLFFRDELPGTEIKVKLCKKIKTGDFLISRRQMTYGGMAMVPPEFDGFDVNDEYEVLVVKQDADFDIRFFNYLSETAELKYAAYVASNGFFAERLRLNLDLDQFLSHRIAVPPSSKELRKIVSVLDTAKTEIKLLEKQLATLEEQKRGLMQKLLTGEIRVKVPKEGK